MTMTIQFLQDRSFENCFLETQVYFVYSSINKILFILLHLKKMKQFMVVKLFSFNIFIQ